MIKKIYNKLNRYRIFRKFFKICKCIILKNRSFEDRVYYKWIKNNEPNLLELYRQKKYKFKYQPKISIIIPLYNTKEIFFKDIIKKLKKQTYSNWELCLADGSPEPIKYINKYLKKDKRIKYTIIGENKGISGNTNEALKLATGDYIGLLDHDDVLAKFALYEVVYAINNNKDVEFIYSDEDRIVGKSQNRTGVFFKPDFSEYTLNSSNYICHFTLLKRTLLDKIGNFKSEYDGSQDFDIVLRASKNAKKIVHINKVLYHWRIHPDSTAGNADAKPYAYRIGKKLIEDTLLNENRKVIVKESSLAGGYLLNYIPQKKEKVSIIVDDINKMSKELKKRIEAIKYDNREIIYLSREIQKNNFENNSKTKIFNNIIEQLDSKYFIILDDSLQKFDINFLNNLVGIIEDKKVAMVGTKLVNSNDKILHCGIVVGMNGVGDFIYKGVNKKSDTYMQRLKIIHNVSAVYYKYTLYNREYFINNKFDEEYNELLTSIDISLKLLKKYQIVLNPLVEFKIKELSINNINKEEKFKKVWNDEIKTDRFFSDNLSYSNTNISINTNKRR